MRFLTPGSATAIVLALFLAAVPVLCAAERKEWVMLTDCQYVSHPDNDGDSFRVRNEDKEYVFRLYFVDTPETNLRQGERTREQSEYFGVTLDDTLKAGAAARDFVRDTLREPFTVWTRLALAGGRGKEPRYYAMVLVGAKSLDEILISKGLAQPKGVRPNLPDGEKASAHVEKLATLEAEARKARAGLWATSAEKNPETFAR
jgi:endonuclease YncB( thermonuclease family)